MVRWDHNLLLERSVPATARGRLICMADDFSPSAERAFELAQTAARAAGTPRLGLEHLLIGVLRCGTHLPVWRPDSRPGAVGPRLADMLVAGLPAGPGTPDGPLKATPAAVGARKRALELSAQRGDVQTLPLHLLVAILEGICADPPLLGWLTGLGPD